MVREGPWPGVEFGIYGRFWVPQRGVGDYGCGCGTSVNVSKCQLPGGQIFGFGREYGAGKPQYSSAPQRGRISYRCGASLQLPFVPVEFSLPCDRDGHPFVGVVLTKPISEIGGGVIWGSLGRNFSGSLSFSAEDVEPVE